MQTDPTFELITVNGKRKWLVDGVKVLPFVAGGSDAGPGTGTPPPPPAPPPAGDPPKTFTQEEVNAIVQKRVGGAKESATADLMKELGITDPAQAKALIAAAKAQEEANATELDKAKKAAEESAASAAKATAELEATKLNTAIVEALVGTGLTISAAKKVRAMVSVDKVDDDAIKTAIEDLKKDMPALFETQGAGGLPGHNPGSPPPGGQGKPNDPEAVALRTLHERHPNLKKT
jgi:hypothetical protein